MHGTTRARHAPHRAGSGVNAVVWIEPGRALIVRGTGTAEPARFELPMPRSLTETPPALADIAHRIGPVDRVLVLGPEDLRIALEREIVAIGHHPETIREEPVTEAVDEAELIARLERLT